MDLKQLRLLCALDDTRHFRKAAEACFISQPALSMRLKSLEEELGVALVLRRQRFEGFTPEGEHLLQYARSVAANCDAMASEATALQGQMTGSVRIGVVPLSDFDLGSRLQLLSRQHPQLRFQLQSLSNEAILERLNDGRLDLGVVYQSHLDAARFEVLSLGQQPCHLLYQQEAMAGQIKNDPNAALRWPDVAALPLGLLGSKNVFRQFIDQQCVQAGVSVTPVVESDSIHQLLQMVDSGVCATVIPGTRLSGLPHSHLRVLPLEALAPELTLVKPKLTPSPRVPAVVFEALAENTAS